MQEHEDMASEGVESGKSEGETGASGDAPVFFEPVRASINGPPCRRQVFSACLSGCSTPGKRPSRNRPSRLVFHGFFLREGLFRIVGDGLRFLYEMAKEKRRECQWLKGGCFPRRQDWKLTKPLR